MNIFGNLEAPTTTISSFNVLSNSNQPIVSASNPFGNVSRSNESVAVKRKHDDSASHSSNMFNNIDSQKIPKYLKSPQNLFGKQLAMVSSISNRPLQSTSATPSFLKTKPEMLFGKSADTSIEGNSFKNAPFGSIQDDASVDKSEIIKGSKLFFGKPISTSAFGHKPKENHSNSKNEKLLFGKSVFDIKPSEQESPSVSPNRNKRNSALISRRYDEESLFSTDSHFQSKYKYVRSDIQKPTVVSPLDNRSPTQVANHLRLKTRRSFDGRETKAKLPEIRKTLVIRDISPSIDRSALESHFSQFGSINKFAYYPKTKHAKVGYETHANALTAKNNGSTIDEHPPFKIFWSRESSSCGVKRKSVDVEEDVSVRKWKPTFEKSQLSLILSNLNSKIEFLKSRDEKIRRTLSAEKSDIQTVGSTVGTCPDMCPELERLQRELTQRVEVYELSPDTSNFDPSRAVKEYQRSSADKENPLPHELRPAPVLNYSMNYLLAHVVDNRGTVESGIWFNFLWNRTRSIRNDITIQDIYCPVSIDIVEKCIRFHIVIGYELCEESRHNFDEHVNNEHLSKSLKSLRQMYEDAARDGYSSPNKSEMIAYEMMLNIDNGDVVSDLQHLSKSHRADPIVQLCMQISKAFIANNFVRFFRLVKRSPYVLSCLLSRYFNRMRISAFKVLCQTAYNKERDSRSIDFVTQLFGFSSHTAAVTFLIANELEVDNDHITVTFSRKNESFSNGTSRQKETVLVDKKKNGRSLGEIINNGPIGNIEIRSPYSSFDESFTPELEDSSMDFLPNEILEEFINKEIDYLVVKMAQEFYRKLSNMKDSAALFVEDVITMKVSEEVRTIVLECLQSEKRQKETFIRLSNQIIDELILDFVVVEVKSLAKECYQRVLEEKQIAIAKEQVTRQACEVIISEICLSISQEVASDVFHDEVVDILHKINSMQALCDRHLQSKCFKTMTRKWHANQQLKFMKENYPSLFSNFQPPLSKSRIGTNVMYDIVKRQVVVEAAADGFIQRLHKPISMHSLIPEDLPCDTLFYSLLCLDFTQCEDFNFWMKAKLSSDIFNKDNILQCYPNVIRLEHHQEKENVFLSITYMNTMEDISLDSFEDYNCIWVIDPLCAVEESLVSLIRSSELPTMYCSYSKNALFSLNINFVVLENYYTSILPEKYVIDSLKKLFSTTCQTPSFHYTTHSVYEHLLEFYFDVPFNELRTRITVDNHVEEDLEECYISLINQISHFIRQRYVPFPRVFDCFKDQANCYLTTSLSSFKFSPTVSYEKRFLSFPSHKSHIPDSHSHHPLKISFKQRKSLNESLLRVEALSQKLQKSFEQLVKESKEIQLEQIVNEETDILDEFLLENIHLFDDCD